MSSLSRAQLLTNRGRWRLCQDHRHPYRSQFPGTSSYWTLASADVLEAGVIFYDLHIGQLRSCSSKDRHWATVVVTLLSHVKVAWGQSSYYCSKFICYSIILYDNLYFLIYVFSNAVLPGQLVHWSSAYFVKKIFPFFSRTSVN